MRNQSSPLTRTNISIIFPTFSTYSRIIYLRSTRRARRPEGPWSGRTCGDPASLLTCRPPTYSHLTTGKHVRETLPRFRRRTDDGKSEETAPRRDAARRSTLRRRPRGCGRVNVAIQSGWVDRAASRSGGFWRESRSR